MQAHLSMRKMPKKKAKTFTNTFTGKCAIIVSVGASNDFSTPFYYTYIYKEKDKKKRLIRVISRFFYIKNFLKKMIFAKLFTYTFFIIASAAAHRVASQAAAASGVSPMAVM